MAAFPNNAATFIVPVQLSLKIRTTVSGPLISKIFIRAAISQLSQILRKSKES
jgi:hypothetical protein